MLKALDQDAPMKSIEVSLKFEWFKIFLIAMRNSSFLPKKCQSALGFCSRTFALLK